MHLAHCLLILLSCCTRPWLVEGSVTSMRRFPALFRFAWHADHSLTSCSQQTHQLTTCCCGSQRNRGATDWIKYGPFTHVHLCGGIGLVGQPRLKRSPAVIVRLPCRRCSLHCSFSVHRGSRDPFSFTFSCLHLAGDFMAVNAWAGKSLTSLVFSEEGSKVLSVSDIAPEMKNYCLGVLY